MLYKIQKLPTRFFNRPFKTSLHPNHRNYGAEMLRECSPHTMCHMSGVRCQVSGFMCQVSRVRCHKSGVTIFFWGAQRGGGSVINEASPSSFKIVLSIAKCHKILRNLLDSFGIQNQILSDGLKFFASLNMISFFIDNFKKIILIP